jgi:hypothetical protein
MTYDTEWSPFCRGHGNCHSDYHEGQGYDSVRSDKQVGAVAPRKGRKETMYAIIGFLLIVIAIEFWYESNR